MYTKLTELVLAFLGSVLGNQQMLSSSENFPGTYLFARLHNTQDLSIYFTFVVLTINNLTYYIAILKP